MAGRPRTPTNILRLRGVEKNHPERLKERENEPVNKSPLGNPPRHLSKAQKAAWREIVKYSISGVLGQADRIAVEMAATLLVKCRGLEYEFQDKVKKLWATNAEQNLLFKYLAQFGMTPADRSKINLPGQGKKNSFEDD